MPAIFLGGANSSLDLGYVCVFVRVPLLGLYGVSFGALLGETVFLGGKFFLLLRVRCLRYFVFVRTISGKGTPGGVGRRRFVF